MKKYFYSDGKEKHGPLSLDELKQENINSDTLIWVEGLDGWTPASTLEELKSTLELKPPPITTLNKEPEIGKQVEKPREKSIENYGSETARSNQSMFSSSFSYTNRNRKMDRRKSLELLGLSSGAVFMRTNRVNALNQKASKRSKRVLRLAHITDIHIRPEHNAPKRFEKCVQKIKKHKVDFFLNGGDTIYAADYDNIKRKRVLEQWAIWEKSKKDIAEYEIYSCLGNHDMWWAAPNETDLMYGKDYVVKQLNIPNRYYSFSKKGWRFIVLDSNNENAGSLDKEQKAWLKNELIELPTKTPVLIMTHYPILNVSTIIDGGNHTDCKELTKLFYKHRDKRINCISGHVHLLDNSTYNNVNYYCNGALSGFWWEDGNTDSAQKYWYHETPPGYAILELYEDGSMTNKYYQHNF